MNIAEKFGRWFVAAVWFTAGAYCILNVYFDVTMERSLQTVRVFDSDDAIYTLAGLAFWAAAYGVVRHQRWARTLLLGLWGLFGYWDFQALGTFADERWFPLIAFGLFFAALLWLLSPAALACSLELVPHT